MKKMNLTKKNQGFTLVELMVGILLSLIVIAATIVTYLSTKRTNSLNEGLVSIQDEARFAMHVLKNNLEKAGWVNNSSETYALSDPIDMGLSQDGGAGSDTIAIRFEACDTTIARNNCSGNDIVDCNGTDVDTGITDEIITNRFRVDANNQLLCNDQPLISNVESFQVLYGVDNGSGITYQSYTSGMNVSQIVSLRFGIIVSSRDGAADTAQSKTINLLGTDITSSSDRKLRQKFESTVMISNQDFKFFDDLG